MIMLSQDRAHDLRGNGTNLTPCRFARALPVNRCFLASLSAMSASNESFSPSVFCNIRGHSHSDSSTKAKDREVCCQLVICRVEVTTASNPRRSPLHPLKPETLGRQGADTMGREEGGGGG